MNEIHIKSNAKYIDVHHNDVVNVDISTKESVSEDLEEVSKKYSSCIYLEEVLSDDDKEVLKKRLVNTFKAGAQWQRQQDYKKYAHVSLRDIHDAWQELIKNNPDIRNMPAVCFARGADWQKEQMMKDAKEGIVTDKGDFIKFMDGTWVDLDPTLGNTPAFSLKEGQKVKLIVIKED